VLKRTFRYIVEKVISHAFEKKVCALSFNARNGILMRSRATGGSKVRGGLGWMGRAYLGTGGELVRSRRIHLHNDLLLKSRRDNCPDELDAYFKSIGGKPQFKAKEKLAKEKPTPVSSAKKRKLADDSPSATPEASTPATDGRGRKRKQTANDTPAADANGSEKNAKLDENDEGNFPAGSWEHEVKSIDTLERGEDGKLWAFILWNDGRHTKHFSETLKRKCPLKMIDFYEAHL